MKFLHSFISLALVVSAVAVPSPTVVDEEKTPTLSARQALSCNGQRTKFKYFGVNQSGAEFGNQNIPGVYMTDYVFPAPRYVDTLSQTK